ncbi:MAG: hypothetical protein K8S87_09490 [Planctomycetes bacterium]|nr:hypothetical protein [Planctomycetota bacterium]
MSNKPDVESLDDIRAYSEKIKAIGKKSGLNTFGAHKTEKAIEEFAKKTHKNCAIKFYSDLRTSNSDLQEENGQLKKSAIVSAFIMFVGNVAIGFASGCLHKDGNNDLMYLIFILGIVIAILGFLKLNKTKK